jgi:hypothetical protein
VVSRIDSDEVERVIEYLISCYSRGTRFHKSAYIRDAVGISSNRVAKILETIRDNPKYKIVLAKYGRRTWLIKKIGDEK